MIGIKNPAVDAMIEHVVSAKTYEDLVAAAKALDRVLLWNHYVVPQWSYSKVRTARWDRFSHHDPLPKYGMPAFPRLWWWDPTKRRKRQAARRNAWLRRLRTFVAGYLMTPLVAEPGRIIRRDGHAVRAPCVARADGYV